MSSEQVVLPSSTFPRAHAPMLQFALMSSLFLWGAEMRPAQAAEETAALADLSIEQLMNEPVTSVSKKSITLEQSPAAISVVSGEDFRRLGLTSIPEALRLVPGMDVARISANQWAISARGFNLHYANKLLVLVDGRTVYTPSFGGVLWDAQDMVLEDLDRMEVIRGPGGTLWGANAVNGVINITSKAAKETQGLLATTTFGTEDQPGVSVRYGGALSEKLHYRAYVKYFNREGLVQPNGDEAPDAWDSIRGGFRADWEPTTEDLITLQGDYYTMRTGGAVTSPLLIAPYTETNLLDAHDRGANILGRWTHTFSERSHLSFQTYFDHFQYDHGLSKEHRDTADVQVEHRFSLASWNDIVWGIGYRYTRDEMAGTSSATFSPDKLGLNLYTAFVQDEITLVPKRLKLILGSKFEHNDYTGWETQPSAGLLWTPTDRQTVWASVSRAVSTPSRIYRDGRVNLSAFPDPMGPVTEVGFVGHSSVVSETLDAYEMGYRSSITRDLAVDIAGFYNNYERLVGTQRGAPQLPSLEQPYVFVPQNFGNYDAGYSYGVEASVQWRPVERWRLTAGYSWLHVNVTPDGPSEKSGAEHQFTLKSYLNLPGNLEFNSFGSYVGEVESLNRSGGTTPIPAYFRVDLGLVWKPKPNVEIGVWGQNLIERRHLEFTSESTSAVMEVPRSVVGRITLRF